jgi:hypothetical protein
MLGLDFKEDNGKVFDLLVSWTLNSPGWTRIWTFSTTRNGKSSWQAFILHFEGDTQRELVKDSAYATIASAKYYGKHICFTFETYVTMHQDAYSDLM